VAKNLSDWIATDVAEVKERPLQWLSEQYFFRDPNRPTLIDLTYFFAPADGVVLYQQTVQPDDALVEIKGKSYSLRDALRDPHYDRDSLVIGIFMTFFDVHINRIPFPGRLSFRELDPIHTYNLPMLAVEKNLVNELRLDVGEARYLHHNQRMVNRVYAPALGQPYYLLQIADYDVDSILPFQLKQNWPYAQNQRFSQVRYGSQVDLIVPLSRRFAFTLTQRVGVHVQAGVDPLIRVTPQEVEEP